MMEILNMSRRTGSGMRPRSALRDRGAGHGFRSLRDAVPDTRVMVAPLARPLGGSNRQDIARMRKLHPSIGVRARTGQLLLTHELRVDGTYARKGISGPQQPQHIKNPKQGKPLRKQQ